MAQNYIMTKSRKRLALQVCPKVNQKLRRNNINTKPVVQRDGNSEKNKDKCQNENNTDRYNYVEPLKMRHNIVHMGMMDELYQQDSIDRYKVIALNGVTFLAHSYVTFRVPNGVTLTAPNDVTSVTGVIYMTSSLRLVLDRTVDDALANVVNESSSYDYYNDDDDPNPTDSTMTHGTAVSGVIGATKGNDYCAVGVANNATLIAIGLLGAVGQIYLTDSQQAMAISHMSDTIDVYCNSYGPSGTYSSSSLGPLRLAAFENNAKYTSTSTNSGCIDGLRGTSFAAPLAVGIIALALEAKKERYKAKSKIDVSSDDCPIRHLEHVMATVSFSYSCCRGAVEVYMVSPSGTKVVLLPQRYSDALITYTTSGSFTWTYKVVHLWGENPLGKWKVFLKLDSMVASGIFVNSIIVNQWSK
ncbi:unnamed protein product [Mytilus edulis]|uniref:P/Homo B domain-containing protein n=1 Tax=Mytilus edulis TaxID=6550 RepID=A0A8S3RZR8_MYTED|nr:unnamed protein product [Mytilus edulis]